MLVTFKEGIVYLSFDYKKTLVEFVKDNFIERKYNPSTREWYFLPYRHNVKILKERRDLFPVIPEIDIIPSYIISEDESGIYIRSRYDNNVINLIKKIEPRYRVWKKIDKIWYVNKSFFHEIAFDLIMYLDSLDDLYICTVDIDKYISEEDMKKSDEDEKVVLLDPEEHKKLYEDLKKKFPFLRDYQTEDVITYINEDNIFNCNDMGLGKTIETGAYIKYTKPQEVLIVCPKSVMKQWSKELFKFFNMNSIVIPDDPKKRKAIYLAHSRGIDEMGDGENSLILITNYAKLITGDFEEFFGKRFWSLVVLDEITKIKDGRTKIHKAVKQLKVVKTVGLTGTPVENRVQELYTLMNVIDWRFFGKFKEFASRYMKPGGFGGYIARYDTPKKLGEKLKGFDGFIRWKKSEVLKELPEVIENCYRFDLYDAERKKYNEIIAGTAKVFNKDGKRINLENILSLIQVLRLAVSDLSIYFDFAEGSSKRDLFFELINDYLNGGLDNKKIVCFSQYKSVVYNYTKFLNIKKIKTISITGDNTIDMREHLLDRFKSEDDVKVLICTDVFAHGINITEASYLINIDIPWNPAILQQRIGRLHRIGQKNPVNVINLIAENTIEEMVEEKILSKVKMFDDIVKINEKSMTTYIKKEIMKEKIKLEVIKDIKSFSKLTFIDIKKMYPCVLSGDLIKKRR